MVSTLEASQRLKERPTTRIDRLGDRLDDRIDGVDNRLDTRIGDVEMHLDEKVTTKTELNAAKSDVEKQIEKMEKRLVVVGIPTVAASMELLSYSMA